MVAMEAAPGIIIATGIPVQEAATTVTAIHQVVQHLHVAIHRHPALPVAAAVAAAVAAVAAAAAAAADHRDNGEL